MRCFFKLGDHGYNFENSTYISNKGMDYGLVKKLYFFLQNGLYKCNLFFFFFLLSRRCHLTLISHQGALPSAHAESISFGPIKIDQV